MKNFNELSLREQNKFMRLRNDFLNNDCPLIRQIYKEFVKMCDMLSIWVTDYGDVDGEELEYNDLYNIFTECENMDMGEPILVMDFRFKGETKDNHQIISNILGTDYYDDNWYRLENGDLNDYIEKLRKVKEFLHPTKSQQTKSSKVKACIMLDDVFNKYHSTLQNMGIGHIADYSNPNCDRYIILMSKNELYNNLLEGMIDADEQVLTDFKSVTDCMAEVLLNITYTTTENVL